MGLTVPREEHPDDHSPKTLADRVKDEIDKLMRERERLAKELGSVNTAINRFERVMRPEDDE